MKCYYYISSYRLLYLVIIRLFILFLYFLLYIFFFFFFFFQAEDGIRDDLVTGVQTCALPICRRSVPCIVVVCERKDFSDSLVIDKTLQHDDPTRQVVLPVDHGLVPRRRLLLSSLAIPQPSDIREVGSDQVERAFHLPGSRHKRRVSQRQRHVVPAEQIRQPRVEPFLVADFHHKATCPKV